MFSPRTPRFEPFTTLQLRWIAATALLLALAPARCAPSLPPRDDRGDPRPPGSALLYADTLDLAIAGASDLESLPGVGPSRARDYLEARSRGRVRTLDDARVALGVTDDEWRKIAPLVSLGGAAG